MKAYLLLLSSLLFVACSNTEPENHISDAEALYRLDFIENLDEREYAKMRKREKEQYPDELQRRIDDLALERVHYENEAIKYQNTRQQRKDLIEDIGQIQMNRAKAINKAYENLSKQNNTYHNNSIYIRQDRRLILN